MDKLPKMTDVSRRLRPDFYFDSLKEQRDVYKELVQTETDFFNLLSMVVLKVNNLSASDKFKMEIHDVPVISLNQGYTRRKSLFFNNELAGYFEVRSGFFAFTLIAKVNIKYDIVDFKNVTPETKALPDTQKLIEDMS